MSDTGVLSQEYESNADLFRAMNDAIVLIKKWHFQLSGKKGIDKDALLKARQLLGRVVEEIVITLTSSDTFLSLHDEPAETCLPSVPPMFVKRLIQLHQGNLEWYVEDLKELSTLLRGGAQLDTRSIVYLDELCSQLDAETSAAYRRLWRR